MKKITYSGLTLVLAIAILASTVTVAEARTKANASTTIPFKMKLQVALSGKAHVTGKVESMSGDSLKISTWGGTWTVTTATSTKFNNKGSLALIKVGDYVQVQGKVSNAQAMTLQAQHINDKSFKKVAKKTRMELSHASSTDMVRGATVQSVATSSLTVKLHNGVSYLINTSGVTKFFSKALNPITSSDIRTGHTIAAYGSTTSSTTTLNATIIHDLSL